VVEEYHIQCTLPSVPSNAQARDVAVVVQLGDVPLKHQVRYISYQEPPPLMMVPTVSNIASRSMDVSWICPGDLWTQLTVRNFFVFYLTTVLIHFPLYLSLFSYLCPIIIIIIIIIIITMTNNNNNNNNISLTRSLVIWYECANTALRVTW
jgi:hypothetical protein